MKEFVILPNDRPFNGCCSRCGGQMGSRMVVALWNDVPFAYCPNCQVRDKVE